VFKELTKHTTWPELVHRGERFNAVPEDYLRWIVEGQNELREEVKASARYWLERRDSNGPLLPCF